MLRLMLCGIVSWLGVVSSALCRADDAEDRAIAFVQKLGGEVTRDEKLPAKPVTGVNLTKTRVRDTGLKELAPLKNLATLDLRGTEVTDAGLQELTVMKKLTRLHLSKVTDGTLRVLREANLLHTLSIAETGDSQRPNKPDDVTELYLDSTQVTDAGLKELTPLKNLSTLYLDGTEVTDVGLKELIPLKKLSTLSLRGTKVTDTGLKELTPLEKLTSLSLDQTRVTDAGVKELQKLLPTCKITR